MTTDTTPRPFPYDAFTATELDLPFPVKIVNLIQSSQVLALVDLARTPEILPKAYNTRIGVTHFLTRSAYRTRTDACSKTQVDRALDCRGAPSVVAPNQRNRPTKPRQVAYDIHDMSFTDTQT
jgi:hypothetical protein